MTCYNSRKKNANAVPDDNQVVSICTEPQDLGALNTTDHLNEWKTQGFQPKKNSNALLGDVNQEFQFKTHAENSVFRDLQVCSNRPSPLDVTTIDLSDENLSKLKARILMKNTSWTNFTALGLANSCILDKRVKALSRNNIWSQLKTLNLESNLITKLGAAALAANTSWTNLTTLNLSNNQIGCQGATALSENSSWTNLKKIYLASNKISDRGALSQ